MVAFRLQRQSGGGSENKKLHRLKGDPSFLGVLSFADGDYLTATPKGYNAMLLQFLVPGAFLNYTRVAVVRSTYGFPINKHDGVTVFEYPNSATPVSQGFLDTNFGAGLQQGQFYYYTLFVKMPNSVPNWQFVDKAFGLVTQDFDGGGQLWRNMPAFYKQMDVTTQQKLLTYTQGGQLQRFMDLLGYELDIIRTEAESLLDANFPEQLEYLLLQLQGFDLSIDYEGQIGDARFRSLVGRALLLRKQKGTQAGFSSYVSSLTDYAIRFLPVRNIMRSVAEARFTDPLGQFVTAGIGGSWQRYAAGTNDSVNSGPGGSGAAWTVNTLTNGYSVCVGNYYFQIVGFSGTPTIQFRLWGSSAAYGANQLNTSPAVDVLANAIVVPTTGVTYTLSWIGTYYTGNPVNVTFTAVNVIFYWFDQNGAFISSDSHAATLGFLATSTGTAHNNAIFESVVSGAAPSNAVFVGFAFVMPLSTTSPGANNVQIWWSGFKLEQTSIANNQYIDPHASEINVIAQRVNLVQNPSAEVDNTLWTLLNTTSFTATANALATAGAKLFSIVSLNSSNTRITTSSFMPINPTFVYSGRFDAMVANTSVGINAIIQWYDGSATPALIRTDTLNFPAPLYTTLMRAYEFPNVVPPSNATQAKFAIEFTGVATGNTHLVDAVMFGPGPPLWYFDGDTQDGLDTPASVTPNVLSDFQWGGTQGKSTSYYYNNYYNAMVRLRADYANWIAAGTTATFYTLIAP